MKVLETTSYSQVNTNSTENSSVKNSHFPKMAALCFIVFGIACAFTILSGTTSTTPLSLRTVSPCDRLGPEMTVAKIFERECVVMYKTKFCVGNCNPSLNWVYEETDQIPPYCNNAKENTSDDELMRCRDLTSEEAESNDFLCLREKIPGAFNYSSNTQKKFCVLFEL